MRDTLEVGLKDTSDDVDVVEDPQDQVCAVLRLEGIDGAKWRGAGVRVPSAGAIDSG